MRKWRKNLTVRKTRGDYSNSRPLQLIREQRLQREKRSASNAWWGPMEGPEPNPTVSQFCVMRLAHKMESD